MLFYIAKIIITYIKIVLTEDIQLLACYASHGLCFSARHK